MLLSRFCSKPRAFKHNIKTTDCWCNGVLEDDHQEPVYIMQWKIKSKVLSAVMDKTAAASHEYLDPVHT